MVNNWPLRAQDKWRWVNDDLMALKGKIVKVFQIQKNWLSTLRSSGVHIIQLCERVDNILGLTVVCKVRSEVEEIVLIIKKYFSLEIRAEAEQML